MRRWEDSINMNLEETMFVYDMQISTITQRLMAGLCEHGNVY